MIFDNLLAKWAERNGYRKGRSGGSFTSGFYSGREYVDPKDKSSLLRAYKHWVYICANKNATVVSKQPLRLYVIKTQRDVDSGRKLLQPTKEIDKATYNYLKQNHYDRMRKAAVVSGNMVVEEVIEHPFLDLIKKPNSFLNQKDFIYLTQLFKELSGDSYWYKNLNAIKQPKELWNLYPNMISIVPGSQKYVAGYIYVREDVEKIPIKPEEMTHFLFPNPNDRFYGASPVVAVASSYNIRENADNYENALFTNMGTLEGYFTTKESVNDAEFERLKEQIKQNWSGVKNAGKSPILDNGLDYKPVSQSPRDLSYVELRKETREEIAAAFGVPMSKIITENVNKANSQTGSHDYEADTIQPRLVSLAEEINSDILPIYSENLFCAFDNPVREDAQITIDRNVKYATTGIYSRNEVRKDEGKPPITSIEGLEGLDIPLNPSNTIPMGQENPNEDNQAKNEEKE